MVCDVINPISSKQVVDVNLLKPGCADFCGNSLNDWLKWMAEKLCSLTAPSCTTEVIDWNYFDVTCLRTILDENCLCDSTQAVVMDLIIRAICMVQENGDGNRTEILNLIEGINTNITNIEGDIIDIQTQIDNLDLNSEELFDLTPYSPWTNLSGQAIKGYKNGNLVAFRGTLTEGLNSSTLVFQIPLGFRPSQSCKFMVANTFGSGVDCTLTINALGTASMLLTGETPLSSGQLSLDGITYFLTF